MTNFVQDIEDFHKKFKLEYSGPPRFLELDMHNFRYGFIYEELEEYAEGRHGNKLENQLDALVDLLYVTFGTAYLHGFDIQEAWNRVHEANMKKVRGVSKRSQYDIVKPDGWIAPDLSDLIGKE